MRKTTGATRWGAAIAAGLLAAALAACSSTGTDAAAEASGTPTPTPTASEAPVQAVDLAAGEIDGPVEVDVQPGADGVGVTFREITLAPGASTGEHCHYGQLIAVVAEGELTHYAETHPGGVRVYSTGEAIIEGAGYPHEGRNEGDVPVVLWVTYVIPEGKPLAETDLANCG